MHDDEALGTLGVTEDCLLTKQIAYLSSMQNFDVEEALCRWMHLKRETRQMALF